MLRMNTYDDQSAFHFVREGRFVKSAPFTGLGKCGSPVRKKILLLGGFQTPTMERAAP